LRLPGSMWCYRPHDDMPEVTPLPALANGYVTFGSFNNINKIGSACMDLWAALLRRLPNARLLMATVPEGETRERLVREFGALGITADRVEFCGKLPASEFLRKLQQVDITLDPHPVNGATTTCESLWLGVPVLTLVGERFLSRAGLSVLSAAGLPEFAAPTPEDFIAVASELAHDLPRLAAIRAGMRERLRRAPLLDQARFTRDLENLYRDAWRRYATA
jgi:protein O-GlcNAc transferase